MPDFTWTPSRGVNREVNFLIKKTQFGEGYVQLAKEGITNTRVKWTLNFNDRDNTEIKAITDFLEGKAGVTPFTFTPPAPYNGADSTVVCQIQSGAINRVDENNLTVEFEEYKTV